MPSPRRARGVTGFRYVLLRPVTTNLVTHPLSTIGLSLVLDLGDRRLATGSDEIVKFLAVYRHRKMSAGLSRLEIRPDMGCSGKNPVSILLGEG